MKMERNDTQPEVLQPTVNVDVICNERPLQSTSDKAMYKGELHKQMKK